MYYLLHRNQLHVSALVPKYVVDFYVINDTYLFHQIVVLDIRYSPILVYKDTTGMTNHMIIPLIPITTELCYTIYFAIYIHTSNFLFGT